MNSTKTLALAAFAALSLGIGSAMAQEDPSFYEPNDFWAASKAAPATMNARPIAVQRQMPQAGSADRPTSKAYLGVSDFSTSGME